MPPFSSIQSAQNSMVKHAYSLKVSKKAKDSEDFLCEGFHLVQEAFRSGLRIRYIFAQKDAWESPEGRAIAETAHREKTRCFEAPGKIIAYVSDTVTPQGIFAVAQKPLPAWPHPPFTNVLAVHQVQDAGNMGTLFRSAEAFGACGVFLTEGCCDPFNPKVVRASMGSLFRVPYRWGETTEAYLKWFSENQFHTYALALKADGSLTEENFSGPSAFWVGSEGAGLPEELSAACGRRLSIPMEGKVESLNVGVAASLALFWAKSKRA